MPQTQFSLITHALSVSFVPDLWGANFRAVENLDAITEQQLFLLEAAYLTLAVVVRVQTEANRLADTAALFMALGGGWPTTCTTPLWRECAIGEVAPARTTL